MLTPPMGLWLSLLAASAPLHLGQPAQSFERYHAPQQAAHAERALRHVVRAWGHRRGLSLAYDGRLAKAAQALVPWAQKHGGEALPLGALREAAWREGWTDGELAAVAITCRGHAMAMALALQLEHALAGVEANHMGMAVQIRDEDDITAPTTVVVALSRRLVHLAPLPQARAPGSRLPVVGRVAVPDVKGVTLITQRPDGELCRQDMVLDHGHIMGSVQVGPAPGTLHVELLVERGRGPEVAASFPIAVGPLSAQDSSTHPPQPEDASLSSQGHDTTLTALLWGLRDSHNLPRPTPHPALMQAALTHAQDMQAHGFFGHVSRRTGDVTGRLRALGQPYLHVVENIAQGSDVHDAFAQWLQSPGHLQNLLDPQVQHVGLALLPNHAQADPLGAVLAVLVMARLP